MILENQMLLYHGSYTPIDTVLLEKCSRGKDFGRGFYLTSDFNQARKFIHTALAKSISFGITEQTQNYGYVSVYRYNEPAGGLKVHTFSKADRDWLWYISKNRKTSLSGILSERISPETDNCDVIIGKIANDTTNPVITAYLNGLYGEVTSDSAVNIAISQLMPERLVDQYCFLTDKAISCLEFVEARKYDI